MTTIDVHAHLACQKNLNPAEAAQTLAFAESVGVALEEDYPAARLLSEMDQGGVQTVVLQGHPPNAGFLSVNDNVAAIVAQHPDRFLAFAGVNPFEGAKAVHELERCVRELGFKGCGEFGYVDILDERGCGQGHATGHREDHGRQRPTAAQAGSSVGLHRWLIVFAIR